MNICELVNCAVQVNVRERWLALVMLQLYAKCCFDANAVVIRTLSTNTNRATQNIYAFLCLLCARKLAHGNQPPFPSLGNFYKLSPCV